LLAPGAAVLFCRQAIAALIPAAGGTGLVVLLAIAGPGTAGVTWLAAWYAASALPCGSRPSAAAPVARP
jgi:hypothetical protein